MKRVRHVETSPLKHVKIKDDDVVPVNWLVVFLTDTIMGRIAHYLETPVLFQFLLGVCKELRNKATPGRHGCTSISPVSSNMRSISTTYFW